MSSRGGMGRSQSGGRSGSQRSGGANFSYEINTENLNQFVNEYGDYGLGDRQNIQTSPPQHFSHESHQSSSSTMPPPSQPTSQPSSQGNF